MFSEAFSVLSLLLFCSVFSSYLHSLFYLEVLFFALLWMILSSSFMFFVFWSFLIIISSSVVGLCILVKSMEYFNQENQVSFLE